jgi:microsomal dipeptidase-like Zn-dependent dipeptidase/gamma-glutamyl-gamma-aminobutyrate hydrolase PuuD
MTRFDLQQQTDSCYNDLLTNKRPVIGITANYGEQNAKLGEGYYKQVVKAGGTPLIIPPDSNHEVLFATLNHIDGLLLSGGADINPLYQGEDSLPGLGNINAERDLPELLITRLAYNRQMPILGICRGIQTLATALGGKVDQDIKLTTVKHSQDADRSEPTHSVSIEKDSTLYYIYGEEKIAVNSFHHQAVSEPGSKFQVVAVAPDGVIEAIESTEFKPILGVQWHPECLREDGLPIFKWLVDEAAKFKEVKCTHQHILTLDTHCDTPMFFPQGINFATRDNRILVDLPKMTEGRLDATIMVAYIPQKMEELAYDYANSIFNQIEAIVNNNDTHLAIARKPEDLWQNKRAGRKSIMLGIENGKALEGNLQNIQHFKNRGIIYITLCHNGDNDICDSACGNETHRGVSEFGRQVIQEMNRLGIMVDLSHAHERSFYDALEISKTPIVCTHSSARALCDHPRNLTDDQMRALAAKGGVCQITLYHGFLKKDGQATILDAMQHLDHAIQVMGIDHVGLGTDFDGDGGICGLANASELTNFTRQLLDHRYSEDDIQKIWGGNFLRVMRQVQNQL